jgi:hypothetical protein
MSGLDYLEQTASYVAQLIHKRVSQTNFHARAPKNFTEEHILGCYRAADVILEATQNGGTISNFK